MKKKINIILVIVVLLLWGSVIYKTVKNYVFSDKSTAVIFESYNVNKFKIVEKDTFVLNNLYRDPFLRKQFTVSKLEPVKKHYSSNKTNKIEKVEVKNTNIQFPSVSYYGYIKSKEKKDEMIIVKINNHLKKLRINETFEGLKIIKIFKDSIYISNSFETRTFHKV